MIKQILPALLVLFLFASCENRYRRANAPAHKSSVDTKFSGKTSDDAYQVSQSEYDDNFVSRYGLLYLKSSNDPFSGRILTVDIGESGEFVSSDETWKEGRKHGKSSKWFSNGIKMYERNYREGRWHGSVTRWWPNGQKMYVRAYTNGVRHGNEATWRSDGTPLSLPADGSVPPMDDDLSAPAGSEDSLPNLELPQPAILPQSTEDSDFDFAPKEESVGEPLPDFSLPVSEPEGEMEDDGFSDLPSFPPMEEEDSLDSSADKLPELPTSEESLPNFPDEPVQLPSDSPSLPGLPVDDTEDLPGLPGLDEASNSVDSSPLLPDEESDDIGLPPLPGGNDGGLPPLPGMEDEGGLPPLPGDDGGGFGDLPPLPPLP
jgi:hypothetical protein